MNLNLDYPCCLLSYQNYSVADETSLHIIHTIDNAIYATVSLLPINSYTELIKIKFQEFRDDKQKLSTKIADETESTVVGIIGHTLILFKESLDPEEQKYRLPE